jgi:nitrate/nitrite transporter NarK
VWTGIALQDKNTPLWVFQACAFLSGIGGGNFACSMSNISSFFPKRLQGTGLGLNAGLGNFGVTTMQVLIPLVMTVGVFGAAGGGSMVLLKDSGWILGKIVAGTPTYIQNAGFIWAAILVPLVLAAWFGMNNLMTLSPNYGGTLAAFAKIVYLWGITCAVGALGLYLYLPAPTGLGLLNMWVALPLIIVATLLVMKLAAFGEMKGNIAKQFEIFSNKHTWSLTLLYIVTFGSFIGFSMALPLSITVIFGVSHVPDAAGVMQHTLKNPNAPSALTYAWIGPFVGALIRPVGGWISDKVGGSIVTQVISAVMVVASGAVGYVMMQAYGSATPEQYFSTFMWLFVLLFAASGIGNGSTPRRPSRGDHGLTTGEDRTWEDAYRNRWAHDKIVRSTHGVNCTGSCSWKIYVKGGIVTWETQQTDYPRTRWDMPNHEPRGCARGASYSWYLYSANRVKYPMVRGRLLERWRAAMKTPRRRWTPGPPSSRTTPRAATTRRCAAWAASCAAAGTRSTRSSRRPTSTRSRSTAPTASSASQPDPGDEHGQLRRRQPLPEPDRRRVHELLRLVLRPAAGQPAGVGRADRRARIGRLVQQHLHHGLGQQRAADAHARRALLHRGALQGRQDGGHHARLQRGGQAGRHLAAPQAGHRCGAGHGHGPRGAQRVLLQAAQPVLRRLRAPLHRPAAAGDAEGAHLPDGSKTLVPDRYLRARTSTASWARRTTPSGRRWPSTPSGRAVLPNGSIGFRWTPKAASTRASGTSRARKRATAPR